MAFNMPCRPGVRNEQGAQVPRLESRGKGSRGPMRQAPWSTGPFAPLLRRRNGRIRQGPYAGRSDTRPPRPAPESAARGGRGALRPISTRRAPQATKSGPTLGSSSRPQISGRVEQPCPACLGDVTVAWGFPLVSDRAAPHSARFRRRVYYHSTAARLQRLFLEPQRNDEECTGVSIAARGARCLCACVCVCVRKCRCLRPSLGACATVMYVGLESTHAEHITSMRPASGSGLGCRPSCCTRTYAIGQLRRRLRRPAP